MVSFYLQKKNQLEIIKCLETFSSSVRSQVNQSVCVIFLSRAYVNYLFASHYDRNSL